MSLMGSDESVVGWMDGVLSLCLCLLFEDKRTETAIDNHSEVYGTMNCQVYRLPELETSTSGTREALQAIIHTILFIRSPGPVAPHDVQCESFQLSYTRIATDNDDTSSYSSPHVRPSSSSSRRPQQQHYNNHFDKVDDSIETFLRALTPIGPELMAGNLAVSFFERRTKNKLFGLVRQEEKVVWEQWILRVVVNNTPKPMGQDEASIIERQRMQVRCTLCLYSYAIVCFSTLYKF